MLDQSFSAENFFRLFFIENRKGTFNRDLLSAEYLAVHEKIKQLFYNKFSYNIDVFKEKLAELNDEKEEALRRHLQKVSEECNLRTFKFKLQIFNSNNKEIYTVNKDAPSFFAMKQLQYNIYKSFKVKQSDRYEIVKQLRVLLEDQFPKVVVRTDLKGFYESIPQSRLFQIVDENQLLNFQSKKLLKGLIYSFEQNKDASLKKDHGLPRGVGVSAYLSELYMRDFDNDMKSIQDLCYYSRYVDDIICVFIPRSIDKALNYLIEIKKTITKYGLLLKDGSDGGENKTLVIDLLQPINKLEFNFLGYKFHLNDKMLQKLSLSDNKILKYHERIQITVEEYNKNSKFDEKAARKLLINRFKFLTGNFHLLNNKKRIKSGIYYSNILLKDNKAVSTEFKSLNNQIQKHINNLKPYPGTLVNINAFKNRILSRYSFHEGFYNRHQRFHSFSEIELNEIVSAWK